MRPGSDSPGPMRQRETRAGVQPREGRAAPERVPRSVGSAGLRAKYPRGNESLWQTFQVFERSDE